MTPESISKRFTCCCPVCRKQYSCAEDQRGKATRCKTCKEIFFLTDESDPERMIEVWFSKTTQFAETTIDRVKRFIEATQNTLDVAVYSITHDWLKESFKSIHKRAKVRILTDKTQAGCPKADTEYYRGLGITVVEDLESGLMHHKFAIRDERAVLTGSYNWTEGAEKKNRENFLVIWNPLIVEAYRREFDTIWAENLERFHDKTVRVRV